MIALCTDTRADITVNHHKLILKQYLQKGNPEKRIVPKLVRVYNFAIWKDFISERFVAVLIHSLLGATVPEVVLPPIFEAKSGKAKHRPGLKSL